MFKFKSSLKALGAATLLGLSSVTLAAPADAQATLKSVLDSIKRDSNEMSAADQARLREFQQDKNAQEAKMTEARGGLRLSKRRAGLSAPNLTPMKRNSRLLKARFPNRRATFRSCSASSVRLLVKRCLKLRTRSQASTIQTA